jgi:lipid A 3-O-deacylase
MKTLILCFVIACGAAFGAQAADISPRAPEPAAVPLVADPFLDEIRLGAFAHDPWSPESGSADLNVELLFAKPWGTGADWWLPRPHVGATINFEGRTSTAYAGATWQYNVTDWAFLEATFGGSVNNGNTDASDPDMNALGCALLFRESASIGFDVTENWRIMATVEHNSNAGLCDFNRGLTNAGVRLGYKF